MLLVTFEADNLPLLSLPALVAFRLGKCFVGSPPLWRLLGRYVPLAPALEANLGRLSVLSVCARP